MEGPSDAVPQDLTETWEERFAALREWKSNHGTCLVPKAAGLLGRWTSRQRELEKKGTLSRSRYERLTDIGFVWDANELAFQERFEALLEFKNENGHTCVPSTHPKLGMWVAKLRGRYRHGKLSSERVESLERIGFVWSPVDEDWMENYNRLAEFCRVRGHCCVSPRDTELERLGWWCNTQRQNHRKGKLTEQRIDLLNRLGFVWNPQTVPYDQHRDSDLRLRPVSPRRRPRMDLSTFSDSPSSTSHYSGEKNPQEHSSVVFPAKPSREHIVLTAQVVSPSRHENLLGDLLRGIVPRGVQSNTWNYASSEIPPIDYLFDIANQREYQSRPRTEDQFEISYR